MMLLKREVMFHRNIGIIGADGLGPRTVTTGYFPKVDSKTDLIFSSRIFGKGDRIKANEGVLEYRNSRPVLNDNGPDVVSQGWVEINYGDSIWVNTPDGYVRIKCFK